MYCQNCGEENADSAKFCSTCGKPLNTTGDSVPLPKASPVQYRPVQQPPGGHYPASYTPPPSKDRSTALILEILPGLFGFLGFGWIYSGNVGMGIAILVGMLIWDAIVVTVGVLTVGFGVICTYPISIVIVITSAMMLNSYTKEHTELFGA